MEVNYDDESYKNKGLKLRDLFSILAQKKLEEKLGNFSREQLDMLWDINPFIKNSYPSLLPRLDYKFISEEIAPHVSKFISLYPFKKPGALIRLLSECTGKSHKDSYYHLLLYFDGGTYENMYQGLRAIALDYSLARIIDSELWIFDVFNIIKDKEKIKKIAEEPFIEQVEACSNEYEDDVEFECFDEDEVN